ncbi:MAG: hypothetical protein SH859_15100 [Hyphomicrobium aestuarii]|nr:hypothetical protein [Hyphomicrobium aestuarii]
MTISLHDILQRVQSWPVARQQDAIAMLEAMDAAGTDVYVLSPDERALLAVAPAEADRGEFVPDEEMEAFWARNAG